MMREVCPQIECDRCGTMRTGQPGTTHDDLRQLVTNVGWKCNKALDRDLCPSCLTRQYGTA